ncbi:MAG: cyclic nucleotide-binding domain-containing protein [Deltaproteobacteria bacterium]|nr:cyclic nucleotide-binding domain-containing protein [Deltaproteobacteria bacterium]
MLSEVINRPEFHKYLATFERGETLFLEGEDTQDLYILVSGRLGILKGKKKIAEVAEAGSLFGEMSFFLGAKRTATVKAASSVEVMCIPKEEVQTFLHASPTAADEIITLLAKRLDDASQIVYGLEEFSDKLPDAVMLSDSDGKILTWNKAAEKLYGREWDHIQNKSVEDIYEDPQEFRDLLEELHARQSVTEKVLKVIHPEKGPRFISTSTTALFDGQHHFKGMVSIGRDITSAKTLERRYRWARIWLMPSFVLLALLVAAIFYGFPYFSKGRQAVDVNKQELRNSLAKDFLLLQSLLAPPFSAGQRARTSQVMKEFFDVQENTAIPYTGLVLLDKDKKVFDAYSISPGRAFKKAMGYSYMGIPFQRVEQSVHSVLSLYHRDKDHPMGQKSLEVAFEIKKGVQRLGWLVFQMHMAFVEREYGIDEEGLKAFHFKKF